LLCAILSVICWSIASVIVKVLTDLHSIEILVIRFVKMIHFFINSLVQNYFFIFFLFNFKKLWKTFLLIPEEIVYLWKLFYSIEKIVIKCFSLKTEQYFNFYFMAHQ
jgi:hypothetical protein